MLNQARYVAAVHHARDLIPDEGLEIAFAGRSNAGKSSAINAITERRRLAFTSKTPGRTQQIVYFEVCALRHLVDLPGYGFAKVPPELRDHWSKLIETYLTQRASLVGLVLIMDIRHPLTPLDRQLIDWYRASGKALHVLLTKADKLSRQARQATLQTVKKQLSAWAPDYTVQLFSALTPFGVEEAATLIRDWLQIK